MIQNLLRALRGFRRQKGFTLLNLTGLYVGISISLLIGLLLLHERSFDRFHRDPDHIYRVVCRLSAQTGDEDLPLTPTPLPDALRSEVGGIQDMTTLHWADEMAVHLGGGRVVQEKNVVYADSAFFDIFNFEKGAGDPVALLRQPNKVMLTESTAARYFPGGHATGKSFRIGEGEDARMLEVAGLLPDPPANSHLQFSMLVSWPTLDIPNDARTNWGWFNGGRFTYLRVPPEMQTATVGERLTALANERKDERDQSRYTYSLQPLSDIHSNMVYAELNPSYTVDYQQFYWLGAISLFLLMVACINYVNLSTAIAAQKAREVGVRKTLGANRSQLAFNFLGQTFVLTLGATVFAVATAHFLLPALNAFLDRNIVANWLSPQTLALPAALCLLTTLMSGLYPAFILAGFSPAEALRSHFNVRRSRASLTLRRGLVTFQFVVAQVFIAAVIIAASQMQFLREKPLGFRHNGVLDIRLPESHSSKVDALKSEIARLPGVKNTSQSTGAPTSKWAQLGTIFNLREQFDNSKIEVAVKICDPNYLKTYGVELLAGRFIEEGDEKQCLESIPEEKRRYVCVLNEAAVKSLGFATPEAALGHEITIGLNHVSPPIVGVVRDFHVNSLHELVKPVAMMTFHQYKRNLGISLEPAAVNTATLASIEKIWKGYYPDALFESAFLDEHLASLYRAESRAFSLFQLVTLLALLLNALGLIGLTAFVVEQKTKEIGVRKVLGANVASVVALLSKDFLKLALISFVIALPIAWWAMNQWLADFAYRVSIQWWMFALAGVAAVAVAFLTVSFQSVRAALANPIKSLRNE